jgi:hypothetical protein
MKGVGMNNPLGLVLAVVIVLAFAGLRHALSRQE